LSPMLNSQLLTSLSLRSNSGLFRCYHCSLLLPEFCEYQFLWSDFLLE
jgi:hypothetical protein